MRRNVSERSEIQRFFPKKKKKKKKKKVFAKIQCDFTAEIQTSNVFSAQNKVISKKKKKKKKKVFAKIQSDFFGRYPNFKRFFRPNLGDLQKKKKKKKTSSLKFRAIFHPISQLQTFEGGLFSYGGGYFPFFTENRPQKHKNHAFLLTSQANGGGSSPPRPPPGYATVYIQENIGYSS